MFEEPPEYIARTKATAMTHVFWRATATGSTPVLKRGAWQLDWAWFEDVKVTIKTRRQREDALLVGVGLRSTSVPKKWNILHVVRERLGRRGCIVSCPVGVVGKSTSGIEHQAIERKHFGSIHTT